MGDQAIPQATNGFEKARFFGIGLQLLAQLPDKMIDITSVINDPPSMQIALKNAMHFARDQLLRIRLQGNGVELLKAPYRDVILGQFDMYMLTVRPRYFKKRKERIHVIYLVQSFHEFIGSKSNFLNKFYNTTLPA